MINLLFALNSKRFDDFYICSFCSKLLSREMWHTSVLLVFIMVTPPDTRPVNLIAN